MDLSRLYRPASIAVVGASERSGSYSSQTLENLAAFGYDGAVYGVNPKRESVHGWPCFPSLSDLPSPADAVVVVDSATPAAPSTPVHGDDPRRRASRGEAGVVRR